MSGAPELTDMTVDPAAGDNKQQDDDARSIAGSEVSTASSRSGIPKPSKLKLPSKIGRPCSGQTKPALPLPPATPTKNVLETEEYEEDFFGNRLHTLPPRGRSRISSKFSTIPNPFADFINDINEMFDELDFFGNPIVMYPPRRSRSHDREKEPFENPFKLNIPTTRRARCSSIGSTATTSSMDALWELHPRRLSEAGLSRHSDNSAILTEDTDSFIIGQRVWVGGSKPGQIAYIGETQFAPGEWAGIVLDQPIGKNDGSVGGVRYFQCEAKRGVFSRLTRLARYPLDAGDACTSPSPTNGIRKSSVSPAQSTRSALSISNTSIASAAVDFKVGDRVIIKSGLGSKIGTLRYMGFTSFANGEWCGVELDEPTGKNDGMVEGKRYFECGPKYGLFAPVHRVSRSPSNRKPGTNCVLHSSMRKGNSRESLNSLSSTMTSATTAARRVRLGVTSLTPKRTPPKAGSTPMPSRTALQDVLKEKQQHIEQLLKERDLERAEITRAASQADEAEQKYAALQREYDQYRIESEIKFKEFSDKLDLVKNELNESVIQVEDEKRKNEDLQFKFEEAAITKGDIEVANEENISKIQALEKELDHYRNQTDGDAAKLTQILEELAKSKEENADLKIQLEYATEKRTSLENEEVKSIELVQSLQSQLEEANETVKRIQEESVTQIEGLATQVAKQTSEFEVTTFKYTKEMEDFRTKYTADLGAKDEEIKTLRTELTDTKQLFENTTKELEVLKYETGASDSAIKKELDKLKMELSAKILENESNLESANSKGSLIEKLEVELKSTKETLEQTIKDAESKGGALMESGEVLRNEIESVKEMLKNKEGELVDAVNKIDEVEKERAALIEANSAKDVKLTGMEAESEAIRKEADDKNAELVALGEFIKKMESNLQEVSTGKEKLQIKLEETIKKLEEESASKLETNEKNGKLELDIGDYQRKLQSSETKYEELSQEKCKLEEEIKKLYGSSGEDSAKLETLNQKISEKEAIIKTIKDECAVKVQNAEHSLQQMEINLQALNQKSDKEASDLRKIISEMENDQTESLRKIEEKDNDNKLLNEKLSQLTQLLQERDASIKLNTKQLEDTEKSMKQLLDQSGKDVEKLVTEKQTQISGLEKRVDEYKHKLETTLKELTDVKEENKVEQLQSMETIEKMKKDYEDVLTQIRAVLSEKTDVISKLQSEIEVIQKLDTDKQLLLDEKEQEVSNLKTKVIETSGSCEEIEKERLRLLEVSQQKEAEIRIGFETQIKEIQSQVEVKNKFIEEAQLELEKLRNDLCNTVKTVDEKDTKLEELMIELKNSQNLQQSEKESGLKQFELMQAELQKLTESSQESNNEITSLQNQLQSIKSELESKSKVISEKDNKIEKLIKEMEGAQENQNQSQKQQQEQLQVTIKTLTSNVEESQNAKNVLEIEKNNYVQLLNTLRLTEAQKNDLMASTQKDLQGLVNQLKLVDRDDAKETILDLQKRVNTTNDLLNIANEKAQKQQTEILNLQNELVKNKQTQLEETVPTDASIINNNTVSNDYKQLLEEKLFAETQIQFLNSIIVDMQKKNEEQKARIEILESGYSPAAADELKLIGLVDKKITPRMYCDICEEFDLHETEDCPLQAVDDQPAPVRDEKDKKKSPPRSYCEICEVFGHLTEDCQDDQTF